ncbi:MAG: insulinase family protein [Rikenellaceae bacterium]|nr:insulinase family protein [Rikenellaceae bacterium]
MRPQPAIVIPDSVDMPRATQRTTSNGVPIYTLHSDDFEVVRLTFVFHAGTSMQHKPFSASATANMLSEGTLNMSAQQIAEKLDFYGSYFDVNIDRDYTYISFCSLKKFFAPTAEVAREVVLHPTFPEREFDIYCSKRKQGLTIERKKVDMQSRELFAEALFGKSHPYGISSHENLYDELHREDLIALYRELYTADNCFVVCSGNIDTEVYNIISNIVEALPMGTTHEVAFPSCSTTHALRRDIDSALQSSIRIGRLLFTRTHSDFVGMQVVAAALGGYFGSRLMQNLREEHGYTYGVMAAMVNFDKEGYLAIATQVARECREDALREIYAEIEQLREELMTDEELQMVKNVMIGEILRILDGPFGIADVTIENIMCGMDNSATEQSVATIFAITAEDVRDLARKYLKREDLVEVVVG